MVTSAISRMGKSPEEGIKAPVKTSTTTQITLFGTGQTLNGVLTGTGDRVLVKDQTVDAENGTYMVGPDAWERTTDMNAADDLANGQLIVDSNTNVLYSIQYSGAWDPGSTPLNFLVLLGAMPAAISLTNSSPIDLADVDVALKTGALDPATQQHLEYDFQAIQSKSNATTAAVLFLNPLGGDINIADNLVIGGLVDGVDIASFSSAMASHVGDATIHFTQASISITESQISDLQAYALDSALTSHTGDATIHFTQAAISITASQISDFAAAVAANAAVALNTAKLTNVPTALSIGTHAIGTFGITSDGSADDVVIPSFTSTLSGVIPGSGGGTVNFMRADGTWAVPPGTGGSNFTVVIESTTSRTAAAFEAVMVDDDSAGGAVTITLPAASLDDQVVVKKLGASEIVTIARDGTDTIDGVGSNIQILAADQNVSFTLIADGGGNWNII